MATPARNTSAPVSPHRDADSAGGVSLIEATIATILIAVTFLALAGVFSSNLTSIGSAQTATRASMFADELLSATGAQSEAALLAMNGNSFFDTPLAADARFRATLSVEQTSATLLTLRLDVVDLRRGGAETLRLLTYRRRGV